jgi:hypothetical protein
LGGFFKMNYFPKTDGKEQEIAATIHFHRIPLLQKGEKCIEKCFGQSSTQKGQHNERQQKRPVNGFGRVFG